MNFKEKTDTELATLLIRDNEAAFSELYVRYKDKLYYFCLHLLKSKEEAIDSKIIYTEYQMILQNAISQLPPQRQKIFNMSRIESMSHKEIAAELGISVNTVQEHISEALKFIKVYFSKHADISISLLLAAFILYK